VYIHMCYNHCGLCIG